MLRTIWRKLLGTKSIRTERRSHLADRFIPEFEALEERALLAGVWAPVIAPIPDPAGAQSLMLLSDGTAMVQGGSDSASKDWYQLKPNAAGNYTSGTWSKLASMGLERLFFGSNMLPNGKILVVGGEYSGPTTAATETNTGEIYNPVTNSWSNIASVPSPGSDFGDGSTEVLPNGTVLAGYLAGTQTYIYNPTTNVWTNGPAKLRNDPSSEEGWVKLPDSSILAYEIQGTAPQTAQRYIPSLNKWVDAGAVPVALESNGGNNAIAPELGPAILLPNGKVFWIGASGKTAIYTPPVTLLGTGSWVAGPVIPGGLGGFDAAAAMMPNGKVLLLAGVVNGNTFPPPTSVFEYDPATNTITAASAPPGPLATDLNNSPVFVCRLMVLPNGQILLADSTKQLWTYTPVGAPANAWRPTILTVTANGGNTYTMTGKQLNGLSEGSTYGDDAENSTNYPIVRVTNPATGTVTYARTFNWSSVDVATGAAIVSTQFTLPTGFVLTATEPIVVIANGIPSLNFFFSPGATGGNPKMKVFNPLRYTYHASTGLYTGSISLANIGNAAVSANSFTLTFPSLPSGVTLVNASGYDAAGHPFITVSGHLKARSSLLIPIVLRNPFHVNLSTFFIGYPIVVS